MNKKQEEIVLTLTQQEAQYLRNLVGNCVVGNGPARALNRGIFDAIAEYTENIIFEAGTVSVTSWEV